MAEKVLATIGRCIYCGRSDVDLSTEHIIPFALGGNHVLEQASCVACAEITKEIEQHVCRPMLGACRVQLRYPTRHKKDRKKPFKIKFVRNDGASTVEVPPEDAPAVLFLPGLDLPGILRGAPFSKEMHIYPDRTFGRLLNPNGVQVFKELTAKAEGSPTFLNFRPWDFGLLLAKIGHCAAMARYHDEAFVPFLPHIIRRRQGYLSHFVGGDDKPAPVFEDRIDDVNTGLVRHAAGEMVFVKLQLFANLGGPVYVIIAGMLTDACSRVEANANESLGGRSIKIAFSFLEP